MRIAGIDPSIRSSGKVIMTLNDDTFDIESVDYYGYNDTLSNQVSIDHLRIFSVGTDYDKLSMVEREDRAFAVLDVDMEDVKYVSFEDYAYDEANRKGSNAIFQIGEFCGGIRRHFYLQGKGIITYGIPQIKHFATGSGSAKKPAMCEAVREYFPQFYLPYFDTFTKQYESPHADLCDAFWMCEILRNHIKYDILGPESLSDETRTLMEYTYHGHDTRALVDYQLITRPAEPIDIMSLGKRKSKKSAKK